MGLFSFFKKNKQQAEVSIVEDRPDISKELFIEERDPVQSNSHTNGQFIGIDLIYQFLQADYESKGYSDALINPDVSYKVDNIKLLKNDLLILVERVNTNYEKIANDLDFHINTRGQAGLIDLVQELEIKKKLVLEHREKIKKIQVEIDDENSLSHRVALSYQRGFMKGLAALTQSKILNNNI